MTAFPPDDIGGFLRLSAGEWLTLRSLLDSDTDSAVKDSPGPAAATIGDSQSWHQADRGELKVTLLEARGGDDWGGLKITLPDQSNLTLIFQKDRTVLINTRVGCWQLETDGSLELELREDNRIVKERIWFSKPNLRLRCTLEQSLDGQPGRASFSSEIRRVSRPPAPSQERPE